MTATLRSLHTALLLTAFASLGAAACGQPEQAPSEPAASPATADPQHEGLTTPHGDHSPHHGGMVLMNGELHYEVVFSRDGAHRVWFTDAVREELPASVARDVQMVVTRPDQPPERLMLAIDDAGESWIADGDPVEGDGVMVKLTYEERAGPHEVEMPFFIPVP